VTSSTSVPIDSILLLSFGGPERPDDVIPFLRNVTDGRGVPEERLIQVAQQYLLFGGKSPINDQNRALIVAVERELERRELHLPVYWGNRNWQPFLTDTIDKMVADGRQHAAVFVTSAYSSFSGCRQYRDDLLRANGEDGVPNITKLRQFFNHPGFVGPFARNTLAAVERLPADLRDTAPIVFTAHSIPLSMAAQCRYVDQLQEAARLVMDGMDTSRRWDVVFQSRSGSPRVPWLEPDVNDHLRALHDRGEQAAVIVPIGFVSDHMEVIYDLDTVALSTARDLGMYVERTASPGDDPAFVSMVVDLVEERTGGREPAALGSMGAVDCLGGTCCTA
jgi:ferrochelatase